MIPWFQFIDFSIGPLRIYVWGLLVAMGIMIGFFVARREVRRLKGDVEIFSAMALWALLGALLGARLVHVFFYEFAYFRAHWGEVFAVWNGGFASSGAFAGGLIALFLFMRVRRMHWKMLEPYIYSMVYALPLGWAIGRIGCFLIHDHPGTLSGFILAVQYPGGARHDLGLYESIYLFALAVIFGILHRRKIAAHWYMVVFLACYGVGRIFLDMLRVNDARYYAFTAMQYLGVLMVVGAMALILKYWQERDTMRGTHGGVA